MTPELLAFLTPQEQAIWQRCEQELSWTGCNHTMRCGCGRELYRTALTALAEARQARDRYQEDAAHKEMDAFNLSQRVETLQRHLKDGLMQLSQCQADRNMLVSQNEGLGYKLLKIKGEWPATDGSPMGILQAKLAQAQEALEKIKRLLPGWREVVAELDDMQKPEALGQAMWVTLNQMDEVKASLAGGTG